MDRPLDASTIRRRTWRRGLVLAGSLAVVACAVAWAPSVVVPTIERARVRTSVVDVGPLEAGISAAGRVLPEVEQVLTSPVDARVLRVRRRAGDRVESGETIVELDLAEARLAVEALDRDLALRRNDERRKKLELESKLSDVEGRYEAQRLELEARRAALGRKRALQEAGLLSVQELKEAELAEARAAIELKQLEATRRLARDTNQAEVEGLALDAANLRSRRATAWRELERGTARADRAGVVTWTLTEEGATVRKGEPVARVADLSAFRVEATVSDLNASRIAAGMPARVSLGEEKRLEGTVSAVDPTIRNGVLSFTVSLAERSHPGLRPNLRVDVDVLTESKARVLRVARGPFASGDGAQNAFVLRGAEAERRRILLGAASPSHFEVMAGLREGEEVIVSEMSDYLHAGRVRLR
jgi:HlyD family secretion protein